jgi:small subunit ribosomal protein S2
MARSGVRNGVPDGEDKPQAGVSAEPLPEWEQELLVGQNAPAGGGEAPAPAAAEKPADSE